MSKQSQVVAGVAGGKVTLVAAFRAGVAREFANTPAGRGELLAWLEQRKGDLVVCEPSGGYAKGLVRGLQWAQRAVRLAAPGLRQGYGAGGQDRPLGRLSAGPLWRTAVPRAGDGTGIGQGTAGPPPTAGGRAGAGAQSAGAGEIL